MPCNDFGNGGVPGTGMEYSVQASCVLDGDMVLRYRLAALYMCQIDEVHACMA